MKHAANAVTAGRLVMAVLLLWPRPFTPVFYTLYLLCGLSDILDGFLARRTGQESQFGAKLDSLADLIFAAICLIRLLPVLNIAPWLWIWVGAIVLVRAVNLISGYVLQKRLVMLHTRANKAAGLLLLLLPLALPFLDVNCAALPVCAAASFAAVQEGHFIRTGRDETGTPAAEPPARGGNRP